MNQTASRERQSGANLGFSLFVKLLVGVNLALAGGILYALSNQSKPSTSSHDDQLDGVAEISSADTPSVRSLSQASHFKSEQEKLQALAELSANDISKLDRSHFGPLLGRIGAWIESDEKAAREWLLQRASELGELDAHPHALDLLSIHQSVPEIRVAERRTIIKWLSQESDGLLAHLKEEQQLERFPVNERLISIAASVMLYERSELFDDFLHGLGEFSSPELLGVRNHFIQKLVHHADSKNLEKVTDLVIKNIDDPQVAANVIAIADHQAQAAPIEAMHWLSDLKMKDLEVHTAAFGILFENIAYRDPEQAAEILTGERFLETFFPEKKIDAKGDWTFEAKEFFDLSLGSFLDSTMMSDSEIAMKSAGSFFSKARQTNYRKRIAQAAAQLKKRKNHDHQHHDEDCAFCQSTQ